MYDPNHLHPEKIRRGIGRLMNTIDFSPFQKGRCFPNGSQQKVETQKGQGTGKLEAVHMKYLLQLIEPCLALH